MEEAGVVQVDAQFLSKLYERLEHQENSISFLQNEIKKLRANIYREAEFHPHSTRPRYNNFCRNEYSYDRETPPPRYYNYSSSNRLKKCYICRSTSHLKRFCPDLKSNFQKDKNVWRNKKGPNRTPRDKTYHVPLTSINCSYEKISMNERKKARVNKNSNNYHPIPKRSIADKVKKTNELSALNSASLSTSFENEVTEIHANYGKLQDKYSILEKQNQDMEKELSDYREKLNGVEQNYSKQNDINLKQIAHNEEQNEQINMLDTAISKLDRLVASVLVASVEKGKKQCKDTEQKKVIASNKKFKSGEIVYVRERDEKTNENVPKIYEIISVNAKKICTLRWLDHPEKIAEIHMDNLVAVESYGDEDY